MEKLAKYIFILLLSLSFLPIFQQVTSYFKLDPVRGYYEEVLLPKWSWESFIKGEFTQQMDEYTKTHFGFYPSFIRIDNQIEFSINNTAKANGVLIGKYDYLYEYKYIDAYYGNDFIGEDSIKTQIQKLNQVRLHLKDINKEIWVVLCPGKASVIPENIPENKQQTEFFKSNYEYILKGLNEYSIPTLDLKALCHKYKGISPYPLFPKLGIHWSEMAEAVAMRNISLFAQKQLNSEVPTVEITAGSHSWNVFGRDDDIAYNMNLLIPLKSELLYYPGYKYSSEKPANKKVLVLSDSFYFGPFSKQLSKNTFGDGAFWYYNQIEYSTENNGLDLNTIDKQKRWEEHDVICIMLTEVNFNRFGFGFIDEAFHAYTKK